MKRLRSSTSKLNKVKTFILLHILLLIYSMSAVCSKIAGTYEFLSVRFVLFYGIVLLILFVYAIAWQQIIKKMPLVTAYANKAITVIWGLIWGLLIFQEPLSLWNIAGAIIIIVGIMFVVKSDEQ